MKTISPPVVVDASPKKIASSKPAIGGVSIIHLLSGGMDSVVMLYDLHQQGCKIHCVLFNYQQRHVQELEWARTHCERLRVPFTTLDLPQLHGSELTDGKGGVIVPNRNAIFLSMAVNVAAASGADTVTFAANKDDDLVFPDCRSAFVETFNEMLKAAAIEVTVRGPYLDKSKAWIARLGADLGVKLSGTWSCYRSGLQPCGECHACLKREAALKEAKLCGQ